MGTLSYALGGAIGGAGQGLAKVGEEGMKEQLISKEHDWQDAHDRTMEQLRAQQAENLQAKGQTFQHGERVQEQEVAAKAAGVRQQFEVGQQHEKLASEEKRTGISAGARVDAAYLSASKGGPGSKGIQKSQSVLQNITPTGPDGKPILGALPEQRRLIYDPNTKIHWVQNGDRMYRAGSDGKPVIDPAKTNRAVDPDSLKHLMANPYAKVPDSITIPKAFKGAGTFKPDNAGMSYMDAFEQEHGYLPGNVFQVTDRLAAASQRPSTLTLPSGRTVAAPQGGGSDSQPPSDNTDDVPQQE